jgi:hypothetical protein
VPAGWRKGAAVTEVVSLDEGGKCLKVSEPGDRYVASSWKVTPVKDVVNLSFRLKLGAVKPAAIQISGTGAGNMAVNMAVKVPAAVAAVSRAG